MILGKKFLRISFIFVLLGILLSSYATYHHYQVKSSQKATGALCNINSAIDCDKVAQSSYSEVLGIPLGIWGISFFLSLLVILFLLHVKSQKIDLLRTYSIFVMVGFLSSIILAFISFFIIKSICVVCLGVYFCITILAYLLWKEKKSHEMKLINLSKLPKAYLIISPLLVFTSLVLFDQILKPQNNLKNNKNFQKRKRVYVNSIKEIKPSKISLTKSALIGNGEDYRKGSDGAKIILTEFADFQCPACKKVASILDEIQKEIGPDKLLLVFKNYPLDKACNKDLNGSKHQYACEVAYMARCAGEQGKFWKFHDQIFLNQKRFLQST